VLITPVRGSRPGQTTTEPTSAVTRPAPTRRRTDIPADPALRRPTPTPGSRRRGHSHVAGHDGAGSALQTVVIRGRLVTGNHHHLDVVCPAARARGQAATPRRVRLDASSLGRGRTGRTYRTPAPPPAPRSGPSPTRRFGTSVGTDHAERRTRCADSTPSRVQDAPTRRPHAYKMRRLDAGPVPPRRDPPVVAPRRPAALYGDRALHPSVTPAGSTRRPPAAPTASSRLGCSIRPGTRVRPLVAPRSDAEVMTTAAGPRPDRHGSRGRDLT
jgi:hypothetical protein